MVCFSLYSASRATTRAYAKLLEPWGLTYTQYLVLVVLWSGGGQNVQELGSALQLDSGTLSPLLRRMEGRDLIVRERSSGDHRMVTVSPTAAAMELRGELAHIPPTIARGTGLPDMDAAQALLATLTQLTAAMRGIAGDLR